MPLSQQGPDSDNVDHWPDVFEGSNLVYCDLAGRVAVGDPLACRSATGYDF